jgi:hypothetical protein
MTVKEELHQLVDRLEDDDASDALDYLRSLAAGEETLSPDEWVAVQAGEAQLARGEYVTLDELRRQPSE